MAAKSKKIAVFAQSRNLYEKMIKQPARENFINIQDVNDVRGRDWGHIVYIGDLVRTDSKLEAYDEIHKLYPNIKGTIVEQE